MKDFSCPECSSKELYVDLIESCGDKGCTCNDVYEIRCEKCPNRQGFVLGHWNIPLPARLISRYELKVVE